MKDKISFSEFLEIEKKLEIKLGTITTIEQVKAKKLILKLTVDFGDDDIRTVITNIGEEIVKLRGEAGITAVLHLEQFPFITNLEPATMYGIESTAMIMIPSKDDILRVKGAEIPNGSIIL